jgi:hypothetical protein
VGGAGGLATATAPGAAGGRGGDGGNGNNHAGGAGGVGTVMHLFIGTYKILIKTHKLKLFFIYLGGAGKNKQLFLYKNNCIFLFQTYFRRGRGSISWCNRGRRGKRWACRFSKSRRCGRNRRLVHL